MWPCWLACWTKCSPLYSRLNVIIFQSTGRLTLNDEVIFNTCNSNNNYLYDKVSGIYWLLWNLCKHLHKQLNEVGFTIPVCVCIFDFWLTEVSKRVRQTHVWNSAENFLRLGKTSCNYKCTWTLYCHLWTPLHSISILFV